MRTVRGFQILLSLVEVSKQAFQNEFDEVYVICTSTDIAELFSMQKVYVLNSCWRQIYFWCTSRKQGYFHTRKYAETFHAKSL